MGRRYDDAVNVRLQDGQVRSFVWDGRIYDVITVVTTWYVRHAWWRDASSGALDALRMESRVWRVEARGGRGLDAGVFDLVEGESWRLIQAWD